MTESRIRVIAGYSVLNTVGFVALDISAKLDPTFGAIFCLGLSVDISICQSVHFRRVHNSGASDIQ